MAPRLVLLGAVASPHGVKGLVKIKPFTERPEDLTAYGPLTDESGQRRLAVTLKGRAGELLMAAIEGVATREAAERLKGTRLYVPRSALPPPAPGQYYLADLEGLAAVDAAGQAVGRVERVIDYGAGTVLEIRRTDGGELLLPFADQYVPTVDLAAGTLTVVEPEEVEAPALDEDQGEGSDNQSGAGSPT